MRDYSSVVKCHDPSEAFNYADLAHKRSKRVSFCQEPVSILRVVT